MDTTIKSISRIEDFFYRLLYKRVSDNVFASNLPISIDKAWKKMVVIDAGTTIRDMDAFGYGNVLVYLYTQPRTNGVKDVKSMDEMETTLIECVNNAIHPHYAIRCGSIYSDYDESRNLHCNIYEINITIV